MQQLCYDKFVIAEIKGKLANICADLPSKELMSTGTYKAIVSGDPVQIYRKHVQESCTYDPYTKYLYSANHIPPIKTEEDSLAWYRRFIFTDFNQTFKGEKKKPRQQLLAELSTREEMSGLLNWAIDGLIELHKNGEISNRPSVEQIRKEYRKRSSTVLAYFDACVKVTNSEVDYVFTDDWFREYVTYCQKNELTPKSKFQFIQDAEAFLPGAYRTKIRPPIVDGKTKSSPISAWRYVKICSTSSTCSTLSQLMATAKQDIIHLDKCQKCGTDGTDGTNSNPDVFENRFCASDCGNYGKPSCPWFIQKIPKENPMPLKCYGWVAPLPTEEES